MLDFLEYLFSKLKDKHSVTHKVGEQEYAVNANGTLGEPVRGLAPQWDKPTFEVQTLSGLKGLCEVNVDDFPEAVGLHVVDYLTVRLVSLKADDFGRRHVYAQAKHAIETPFKFAEFMPAEKFLIDLRTSFLFNDNAVKIQQVCSNLSSGMTVNLADDGVSQQLEVNAGTVSKSGVVIPAEGIALIPWRSFRDADPVESKFLLRLKGVKDSLPVVALYEIDQKWKLDTVHAIGDWLHKHIKGVTVIA